MTESMSDECETNTEMHFAKVENLRRCFDDVIIGQSAVVCKLVIVEFRIMMSC